MPHDQNAVRFGNTRERERALGVDHWGGIAPDPVSVSVAVGGEHPLAFSAICRSRDRSGDTATLLEDFASSGGDVAFAAVQAQNLMQLVMLFGIDQSYKGGSTMNTEPNKTIVRRYFEEVFNAKQLELVGQLFAPDAIYSIAGLPEPVRGSAAIQGAAAGFLAGIPDLHMTIESLIAEADQVAVRYTGRGTHQGDLMGIPPTGNHVVLPGIAIYRLAEGKIAAGWDSADIVALLAQLGALPMATPA